LLLEAAGRDFQGGFVGECHAVDQYFQQTMGTTENILLKAHAPGPLTLQMIQQRQIKNIYTYRDPRDSLCSRLTFLDNDFVRSLLSTAASLPTYCWYRDKTESLFVRYDDVVQQPQTEIQRIAEYLGLEFENQVYQTIGDATSLESSQKIASQITQLPTDQTFQAASHTIDRRTLLHEGHISGGGKTGRWMDELTTEQQILAHAILKPLLFELGYETEEEFHARYEALYQRSDSHAIAQQLLEQGEWSIAVRLYEEAIALEPQNPMHYWYLGLALLLHDQVEDAEAIWLEAIAHAEADELDTWMQQLVDVLEQEAQRQENLANLELAVRLRYQIHNANPFLFNNALHLIQHLMTLEQFTPEVLEDLNLLENLTACAEDGEVELQPERLMAVNQALEATAGDSPLVQAWIEATQPLLSSGVPH
jgi:tetratricopeptide (TPR) repeat protein